MNTIVIPVIFLIIYFSTIIVLIRKKGNPERRIKEAEEEKDKQYSLLSHTALFQFQMDVLYDTLRKREAELEELRPFQEENIKLKKELKKWTDPEKIEFT